MTRSISLEAVIAVASKMKDCLEGLLISYSELVPVIDEEHNAIREVAFEKLNAVNVKKNAIGESIEKMHSRLRVQTDDLTKWHASYFEQQPVGAAAISDCIVLFQEINSKCRDDKIGSQILDHIVIKLQKLTETFQNDVSKLKPKIDMNKYLLEKLIRNYRDSYRFWQEIAAATISPYNAKGVQKAKVARSSLQVKA